MPHYVYILYSAKHDKFYVGESADVHNRLLFHNHLSEHSYTSKYKPWTIQVVMALPDYSCARNMERHIKRQKNRRVIKLLVHDEKYRKSMIGRFSG